MFSSDFAETKNENQVILDKKQSKSKTEKNNLAQVGLEKVPFSHQALSHSAMNVFLKAASLVQYMSKGLGKSSYVLRHASNGC